MAQTFTSTEVTTTTNVFGDNQSQRTNENTLRSNFSGATQPSDPVVGQHWYDTGNNKEWQYNGSAWVPIDTNSTTQVDVSNAKGNLTTLTNYLRVAHNDDGTLKTSPATAIDEFKDNALVITYVSPTSFTVPTDLTSIFTTNRKLKVYLSASTVITYVSSSSYNSGANVTTVVMGDAVLDSSVTAVKFSIVQYGERHDTMHQSDMTNYAPLASPVLTGIPTAPTAAKGTSTTQLATTAFVANSVGNVVPVVDHIASGRKISGTSGLSVTVTAGTSVINSTPVSMPGSTISIPARKACLICDKSDGTTEAILGSYPLGYVDNNTVGLWIFNKSGNIPNSAFGLSSSAVANDLVPSGGIQVVDGWCDYAAKFDGTSGYYASSNYTNFPIGATEREMLICFTSNSSAVDRILAAYGADANNDLVGLRITNRRLKSPANEVDLSYDTDAGIVQLATISNDGSTTTLKINGVKVYSVAQTLATTASLLYVCRYLTASLFSPDTIHFIELRNKIRPDSKTAEIANKLMLPCFYTKSASVYPTIPPAYLASYHEYKFDETTGATIADSNTASPLNGTATGTTIVDSDLSLGKARKFNGTSSDKISFGSFACGSQFSWACVVTPIGTGTQVLWSNRTSTSVGNVIYLNGNNLMLQINSTVYTLLSGLPNGKPVFVGVSIDGTTATVFVDRSLAAVSTIITLNTTAATAYMGYDVVGLHLTGTAEYVMFGNFALSQADMQQIYNSLMKTGRRSIVDDVVPANTVAVAYAKTSSSGITDYNDLWPMYGRREGATGGNRKMFLGWIPFTAVGYINWSNPFGTRKIRAKCYWAQDGKGTNEIPALNWAYDGGEYGIREAGYTNMKISMHAPGTLVALFNGAYVGTGGYLGCYAEMLEDYTGVV